MAANVLSIKHLGTAQFADSSQPVPLHRVSGPAAFSAVVFQCGMNEDSDGAPKCYGPPAKGPLEYIGNATNQTKPVFQCKSRNTWEWAGLYARTRQEAALLPHAKTENIEDIIDTNPCLEDANQRFPVKQRAGQPELGFYVSRTSTAADESKLEWDQRRYWDASQIAYAALTPALTKFGVKYGDFGMAIRNGLYGGFFFADWGNGNKVGECSRSLFRYLFPRYPNESNESGVSYLVFPGSGGGATSWKSLFLIQTAIRAEILKLQEAENADELPLFLALGANLDRLKATLRRLNDLTVKFPTFEYDRLVWMLSLLGYHTDGDFHPSENSPNR